MNKSSGSIGPGPCGYEIPDLPKDTYGSVAILDPVEHKSIYKNPPRKKYIIPGPNFYQVDSGIAMTQKNKKGT